MSDNALVDAQAVADHFGVSTWTVGLWRREGRIPSCKIGYRTVRYDLAAVARALATGTKKASGRKARKPTPRPSRSARRSGRTSRSWTWRPTRTKRSA